MSGVFKALGDPTRREIVKLLRHRDLSAGEIASHFNISKPAITKHLDILYKSELVTREKKGPYVIYSINLSVLQETLGGFLSMFQKEEEDA